MFFSYFLKCKGNLKVTKNKIKNKYFLFLSLYINFFMYLCTLFIESQELKPIKATFYGMAKKAYGNKIIQYIVIFTDFILLNVTLLALFKLFPHFKPNYYSSDPRYFLFVANVAMAFAQYFFSSIIHQRIVSFEDILKRSALLALSQGLIMFFIMRILSGAGGLFNFCLLFTPTFFIFLLTSRLIERKVLSAYRRKGGNTRSVVFIGSDSANMDVYKQLVEDPSTGYNIIGYFSNDEITDKPEELKKLGSLTDLDNIISSNNIDRKVDDVYCSLSHDDEERILRIMRFCDANVIHFSYVPRMVGNYRLNLKPEKVGDINVFTNVEEPLQDLTNRAVKRTFDICVSFVVCICMLPILPIIALIIKLQSKGPVFFKQARTGINGKTFMCYKFRSMHINSEADMQQATLDDPRKFPFGQIMRKTNLDEFPQFFNVLIGDMSIVGPRPHMLYHTETYGQMISKYMVRHLCKPGITGWAQVTGFRGETKELWQMEERVKRDIWYIEHWTFWLDIKIILKTFLSLFVKDKNAY